MWSAYRCDWDKIKSMSFWTSFSGQSALILSVRLTYFLARRRYSVLVVFVVGVSWWSPVFLSGNRSDSRFRFRCSPIAGPSRFGRLCGVGGFRSVTGSCCLGCSNSVAVSVEVGRPALHDILDCCPRTSSSSRSRGLPGSRLGFPDIYVPLTGN